MTHNAIHTLVLAAAVCSSAICTGNAAAQSAEFEGPSIIRTEFVLTESVPAGVIAGVVLDVTTGRPVADAQVHFVFDIPDTVGNGAITDSLGRFWLVGLKSGPGTFKAYYPTYDELATAGVVIDSLRGLAARVGLHPMPLDYCNYTLDPPAAFKVVVYDVITGNAPKADVTAVFEGKSRTDTVRAGLTVQSQQQALSLRGGLSGVGVYSIEVSSPGYRSWKRDGIVVRQVDSCRRHRPRALYAWLLPEH